MDKSELTEMLNQRDMALAAAKAELAAEVERLKDLHRSILWFVEEHKKIKNCKKWMPLIEEKAKAALEVPDANL